MWLPTNFALSEQVGSLDLGECFGDGFSPSAITLCPDQHTLADLRAFASLVLMSWILFLNAS